MKYYFPENIFTKIITSNLPNEIKDNIEFVSASLISSRLMKDDNAIGLIPTLDLIHHKEFNISKSFGISFEESLCNTYLYFFGNKKTITDLYLAGDISSLEVILSKIFFKEMYSTDIEVHVLTEVTDLKDKNVLITGDINFKNEIYKSGISFSEEVIETLSRPYVNYLLASLNASLIEEFNQKVKSISAKLYSNVEKGNFGSELEASTKKFIQNNISSLICEFDEQDIEGLKQLLQLPYFHGVLDEIIEVKLV